jgi:hypothetical protein
MAACLKAIWPVVSTTIFSNQTKMASVDKEIYLAKDNMMLNIF